jgi:cystathionine beta-lyase family protein involved in aluminum resistance
MLSVLSGKGAILKKNIDKEDSIPITSEGQYVHKNCRKNYSSRRKILRAIQNSDSLQQRHSFSVNHEEQVVSDFPSRFDFNKNCFLCGNSADISASHKAKNPVVNVKSNV